MTQPDPTTETNFRRATAEEIAAARAWVNETMGDAPRTDPDEPATHAELHHWSEDAKAEYEHALEIIIFANGGRLSTEQST